MAKNDEAPELTEALAHAAEALVDGHSCESCGRTNDWLAERIDGDRIILRCDDCMQTSVAVPLSRVA